MVFKLVDAPSQHWRYLNAAHLVVLVRAGAQFRERSTDRAARRGRNQGHRVITRRCRSTTLDDSSGVAASRPQRRTSQRSAS
jgi:hypothetical protein